MSKRSLDECLEGEKKPVVKPLYFADLSYYPRGPDKVFALAWTIKDINIATAREYNIIRDRDFDERLDVASIDHSKLLPWQTAQPEGAITITLAADVVKNEKNFPCIQDQIRKVAVSELKKVLVEAGAALPKKVSKKELLDLVASVVVGDTE